MTSTSVAPSLRSRSATHSAAVRTSAACSGSEETLGIRQNSRSASARASRDSSSAASMSRSIGMASGAGNESVMGSPGLTAEGGLPRS
jgi:hypothetical protein